MAKDGLGLNGRKRDQSPTPGQLAGNTAAIYTPANRIVSSSASAMTANRLYFHPFNLPGYIVNRALLEVTVGAAGFARFGLYANEGGRPTTLMLDCGEVITDNVATVEAAFADTELPDWCWLGAHLSAGPTLRSGNVLGNLLGVSGLGAGSNLAAYVNRTYGLGLLADASAETLFYTGGFMPGLRRA